MTKPTGKTADTADRAIRAATVARAWLDSSPMHALFAALGNDPFAVTDDGPTEWLHLNESVPQWVEALVAGDDARDAPAASAEVFDALRLALRLEQPASVMFNFRGDGAQYKERSQATSGGFDAETRARVVELTDELGLVTPSRPEHASYGKTLILGGGYRSPLLRARYAAQLKSEGVDLGEIYLLGSPRFLIADPPEKPVVAEYAADASDEYDLMVAAAVSQLGFEKSTTELLCGCESVEIVCPSWDYASSPQAEETPPEYTHERAMKLADGSRGRKAVVLSARTSRPPFRPDTTDTFDLWARFAQPEQGEQVLAVTTQVFVPFQRFDGMRRLYLDLGVEVDTVGFGAGWGDRPLTAEYLLQETLSGIRSARRMLVSAAVASAGASEEVAAP